MSEDLEEEADEALREQIAHSIVIVGSNHWQCLAFVRRILLATEQDLSPNLIQDLDENGGDKWYSKLHEDDNDIEGGDTTNMAREHLQNSDELDQQQAVPPAPIEIEIPWHISNKYYTCLVWFTFRTSLQNPTYTHRIPLNARPPAFIYVLPPSGVESPFDLVPVALESLNERFEPEIRIAVRTTGAGRVPEREEVDEAFEEVGYEFVDEDDDDGDEDDDNDEEVRLSNSPLNRIIQSLHAHVWPNLVLKPKPGLRSALTGSYEGLSLALREMEEDDTKFGEDGPDDYEDEYDEDEEDNDEDDVHEGPPFLSFAQRSASIDHSKAEAFFHLSPRHANPSSFQSLPPNAHQEGGTDERDALVAFERWLDTDDAPSPWPSALPSSAAQETAFDDSFLLNTTTSPHAPPQLDAADLQSTFRTLSELRAEIGAIDDEEERRDVAARATREIVGLLGVGGRGHGER